jgi:hypothetical protein
MLRKAPYEVRHLLIRSIDGTRVTTLAQLISVSETLIATGTEYEMKQKAEALTEEWAREGFHFPSKNEQAWDSLVALVALLTLMGYSVVYDPDYVNLQKGNVTGAVPLAQWPGKHGKKGGGYRYAFMGTTLLAWPTQLPAGHGINMEPATSEEFMRTMQQAVKLQREIGPGYEFVLG